MQECPQCGFPLKQGERCPKCQIDQRSSSGGLLYEIDVAHNGETWEMAKGMIIHGLDQALYGHYKGLRVIHGYGSFSGESVIAPRAISLMRHLAEVHDGRFAKDRSNPGVSLIWLNKGRSETQAKTEQLYYTSEKKGAKGSNWFDEALKRTH